MEFGLFCSTMIAVLFGLAVCFMGYRLFIWLLPIWGFFFGFVLGAQALQLLFGGGFLATVTGWVVGFFVGLLFALLSYLFYAVAVGLFAGSFGYALGAGFMGLIGIDWGWLVFLVGLAVAIVAVVVTFYFNLQKWAIIVVTALGGAGIAVVSLMGGFLGLTLAKFFENPVRVALSGSPIWTIVFLVVAVLGFLAQYRMSQDYEFEEYENRI